MKHHQHNNMESIFVADWLCCTQLAESHFCITNKQWDWGTCILMCKSIAKTKANAVARHVRYPFVASWILYCINWECVWHLSFCIDLIAKAMMTPGGRVNSTQSISSERYLVRCVLWNEHLSLFFMLVFPSSHSCRFIKFS